MSIQNQWGSSIYNITVNIDRHVSNLQLIDEKQKMIQIGAGADGLIVINIIFNQSLQVIMNHSTDVEGLHRERWERIINGHVVVLLDWYGDLNLRSSVFSNPESEIISDLNVADNVAEFYKANSEHGTLVNKNR